MTAAACTKLGLGRKYVEHVKAGNVIIMKNGRKLVDTASVAGRDLYV